jgi:nitrogen fixation protein FixH
MRRYPRYRPVPTLMKSVLFGVVIAVELLVADFAGVTFADQSMPTVAVAYQDGKLTGIYEATIQIDHKTFSFVPEVVIQDRHGDPLEASSLRVDIEVKYHLLKGTTDKIDQIILYLPE